MAVIPVRKELDRIGAFERYWELVFSKKPFHERPAVECIDNFLEVPEGLVLAPPTLFQIRRSAPLARHSSLGVDGLPHA
eukprot:7991906-Pyramimonas_sp.AAC.1